MGEYCHLLSLRDNQFLHISIVNGSILVAELNQQQRNSWIKKCKKVKDLRNKIVILDKNQN